MVRGLFLLLVCGLPWAIISTTVSSTSCGVTISGFSTTAVNGNYAVIGMLNGAPVYENINKYYLFYGVWNKKGYWCIDTTKGNVAKAALFTPSSVATADKITTFWFNYPAQAQQPKITIECDNQCKAFKGTATISCPANNFFDQTKGCAKSPCQASDCCDKACPVAVAGFPGKYAIYNNRYTYNGIYGWKPSYVHMVNSKTSYYIYTVEWDGVPYWCIDKKFGNVNCEIFALSAAETPDKVANPKTSWINNGPEQPQRGYVTAVAC